MPITEELQFSVLSAPLAAADRRLFSQAWYSALYRTDAPAAAQTQPAATQATERCALPRPSAREQRAHESMRNVSAHPTSAQRATAAYGGERRAPRLQLARKIARFVLQLRRKKSGATFTIGGARGRVRVLVRADGDRVLLIALCSEPVKATVAAALAQARYALASRGTSITARIWERGAC